MCERFSDSTTYYSSASFTKAKLDAGLNIPYKVRKDQTLKFKVLIIGIGSLRSSVVFYATSMGFSKNPSPYRLNSRKNMKQN